MKKPDAATVHAAAIFVEVALFNALFDGDVEVVVGDDGESVHIARMTVGEDTKSCEAQALDAAIEVADMNGVPLELSPDEGYYGDDAAVKARLGRLYSKFGFADSGHRTLVRQPMEYPSGPRSMRAGDLLKDGHFWYYQRIYGQDATLQAAHPESAEATSFPTQKP